MSQAGTRMKRWMHVLMAVLGLMSMLVLSDPAAACQIWSMKTIAWAAVASGVATEFIFAAVGGTVRPPHIAGASTPELAHQRSSASQMALTELDRLTTEIHSPPRQSPADGPNPVCRGTLLSRRQYLIDIDRWGYGDGRLAPEGNLTHRLLW